MRKKTHTHTHISFFFFVGMRLSTIIKVLSAYQVNTGIQVNR